VGEITVRRPEATESPKDGLPEWARELIALYESGASSQFVLYGNVEDRLLLPAGDGWRLGGLEDALLELLLPGFEVVLSFDLGNGIRVEKGREAFSEWPYLKDGGELPRTPRSAVETLTRYFRFVANLRKLSGRRLEVACLVRGAHLLAPAVPSGGSYDLHAIALLLREWATEESLVRHSLATFLITPNLNDLHPIVARCPRTAGVKIPLPTAGELARGLELLRESCPRALGGLEGSLDTAAGELQGASLGAVERLLQIKQYHGEELQPRDLVQLKKSIVEDDCGGLIDFVRSRHTLESYEGPPGLKRWLRQDLELWRQGDLKALPKGYLLCGPVGTGKTFLAECLSGEAGVPVVVIKNFRDKWVGTTEGNLETIFRLLQALGRTFVFIDEADQTLGRRDSGTGDSGLSGRVYSMIAQEMSNPDNRGRIIWILASSRPDLIEVDLKRPGRIDRKIPLFPAATREQGLRLLKALGRRYDLDLSEADELVAEVPELLTPAAAETLAVQAYRLSRTESLTPIEALRRRLATYRPPVPREVLDFQMRLAAAEATDMELVPEPFRGYLSPVR